jgi:hypothetical protein
MKYLAGSCESSEEGHDQNVNGYNKALTKEQEAICIAMQSMIN